MPRGQNVLLHVPAIQGHCTSCGRERIAVAYGADPAPSDTHNISIWCTMASIVAHGLHAERIRLQKERQATFFSAAHPSEKRP